MFPKEPFFRTFLPTSATSGLHSNPGGASARDDGGADKYRIWLSPAVYEQSILSGYIWVKTFAVGY